MKMEINEEEIMERLIFDHAQQLAKEANKTIDKDLTFFRFIETASEDILEEYADKFQLNHWWYISKYKKLSKEFKEKFNEELTSFGDFKPFIEIGNYPISMMKINNYWYL